MAWLLVIEWIITANQSHLQTERNKLANAKAIDF